MKTTNMKANNLGILIWGGLTALLAVLSLLVVVAAGLYLNAGAQFSPAVPVRLPGLYLALKEHGVLVAGVLGFSALSLVLFVRGGKTPPR
jgi:hypothetical protein